MSINVSGTEGYADSAQSLIEQWQDMSFERKHESVMHLLPPVPARVVDLGAGIGTDAAALAAMGYTVVAAEPVDALRCAGIALHSACRIDWIDDSLPDLPLLHSRRTQFDLAMLSAVWMHLDEDERRIAMPRLASLLRNGATLIMSLRHGPIPKGRRMFDVSADETVQLARGHGLRNVLNVRTESAQVGNRHMGVTWTRLVFVRDDGLPSRRSRPNTT